MFIETLTDNNQQRLACFETFADTGLFWRRYTGLVYQSRLGYAGRNQAVETALALWVAMQNSVSQRYDAEGLAKFWGPDV